MSLFLNNNRLVATYQIEKIGVLSLHLYIFFFGTVLDVAGKQKS